MAGNEKESKKKETGQDKQTQAVPGFPRNHPKWKKTVTKAVQGKGGQPGIGIKPTNTKGPVHPKLRTSIRKPQSISRKTTFEGKSEEPQNIPSVPEKENAAADDLEDSSAISDGVLQEIAGNPNEKKKSVGREDSSGSTGRVKVAKENTESHKEIGTKSGTGGEISTSRESISENVGTSETKFETEEVKSGSSDTSVESGSRDTSVESGSSDTSVESGSRDTSVESGSSDTSVESGSSDASVESGSSDASVESGSSDTSVESGSSDASVESGSSDTSVESGSSDTNVESGSSDTSAESGSSDTSVESGSRDTSVESGSRDTSVESGSRDTSVESGSRDTSVESGNDANKRTASEGAPQENDNSSQSNEEKNKDQQPGIGNASPKQSAVAIKKRVSAKPVRANKEESNKTNIKESLKSPLATGTKLSSQNTKSSTQKEDLQPQQVRKEATSAQDGGTTATDGNTKNTPAYNTKRVSGNPGVNKEDDVGELANSTENQGSKDTKDAKENSDFSKENQGPKKDTKDTKVSTEILNVNKNFINKENSESKKNPDSGSDFFSPSNLDSEVPKKVKSQYKPETSEQM